MSRQAAVIPDEEKKFKVIHSEKQLLTVEEFAKLHKITARGRIYAAIADKILTPTYIGKSKKLFIDPVINKNVKFIRG